LKYYIVKNITNHDSWPYSSSFSFTNQCIPVDAGKLSTWDLLLSSTYYHRKNITLYAWKLSLSVYSDRCENFRPEYFPYLIPILALTCSLILFPCICSVCAMPCVKLPSTHTYTCCHNHEVVKSDVVCWLIKYYLHCLLIFLSSNQKHGNSCIEDCIIQKFLN